jgi:hypothetical protein
MEWDITVHAQEGYVEILTSGFADADGSLGMARALMEKMRELKIRRALIDHRNITGVSGGAGDMYFRPRKIKTNDAEFRVKIAEIVKPEHQKHFHFLETVCRNQGFLLAVFPEREPALEWLLN